MEEEVDMILQSLTLTNFRNFSRRKFQFAPGATLIYGENATGKSNLLEAIYFLASGGSLRAEKTAELVKDKELFAKIEALGILKNKEPTKLGVFLERENGLEDNLFHKKFRVNGVPRYRRDFVGNLKAVLFSPEQLNLINNGPSYRRNYLDLTLSQIDRNYLTAISTYNKTRFNRNKLLYQIGAKISNVSELGYWDDLLVENSLVVHQHRSRYINFINNHLIEGKQKLGKGGWCLQLKYVKSPLSLERLAAYRTKEIAAGRTLIGSHREDIIFFKTPVNADKKSELMGADEGTDLHRYGSRGEQRLAVFALKLAEWEFLARDGDKPLLLLDDIFSELDGSHRQLVLQTLGQEQTLVTAAEEEVIRNLVPKDWPVIELSP